MFGKNRQKPVSARTV